MTDRDSKEGLNESPPETNSDEPIETLADYGEEPARGFLERVRSSIQRRELTCQLADLFWSMPLMVLFEYLRLLLGFSDREKRSKGEQE